MYQSGFTFGGAAQADHNAALNYYYSTEVQMRRDNTKRSVAVALPYIQQLLDYVHEKDPRFKKVMIGAGSYWQGLKVDKADEFDVMVALDIPGQFQWGQTSPRYLKLDPHSPNNVVRSDVPLPGPETGYMATEYKNPASTFATVRPEFIKDDSLVPLLVRNRFKDLVKQAVRDLDLRRTVEVSRRTSGPAITVYLKPSGHHMISVDFAPIFQSGMSFTSSHGWPRANANWPSQEKIQQIKEVGINQTAKKDFDWLQSFAECEKELVKEIDKDGGCRKKCHRIMKSLAHNVWCPGPKPVLSSYILKNVWFWECERHPYPADWSNEMMWERFSGLTTRLLQALRQRHLSVYFYPDVNLLKDKDEDKLNDVIDNIERFMHNPEPYLRGGA